MPPEDSWRLPEHNPSDKKKKLEKRNAKIV